MKKLQLTKLHEKIFDICVYISYFLLIISLLGLSQNSSTYLKSLDFYIRLYISLFLVWRFNPLRSNYKFTDFDRRLSFSAGLFILTSTILTSTILTSTILKQYVNNV
jgi:hypothetical protein